MWGNLQGYTAHKWMWNANYNSWYKDKDDFDGDEVNMNY